jgi:hypothetical protein
MTDTLTPVDPWPILRAVLETIPAHRLFSAASWHTEADLAQLNSRQIDAAHKQALKEGWLERVGRQIEGEWYPNMTQATHELAKGRWIFLYVRTDKGQAPIPGQVPLFEVAS